MLVGSELIMIIEVGVVTLYRFKIVSCALLLLMIVNISVIDGIVCTVDGGHALGSNVDIMIMTVEIRLNNHVAMIKEIRIAPNIVVIWIKLGVCGTILAKV